MNVNVNVKNSPILALTAQKRGTRRFFPMADERRDEFGREVENRRERERSFSPERRTDAPDQQRNRLEALERRPGDDVPRPRNPQYDQRRWADLDDKEKAERDSRQQDILRQRREERFRRPIPFIWAPSPPRGEAAPAPPMAKEEGSKMLKADAARSKKVQAKLKPKSSSSSSSDSGDSDSDSSSSSSSSSDSDDSDSDSDCSRSSGSSSDSSSSSSSTSSAERRRRKRKAAAAKEARRHESGRKHAAEDEGKGRRRGQRHKGSARNEAQRQEDEDDEVAQGDKRPKARAFSAAAAPAELSATAGRRESAASSAASNGDADAAAMPPPPPRQPVAASGSSSSGGERDGPLGAAAAVGSVTAGGSFEAPASGEAAKGAAEAAAAASTTGRGSSECAPLVLAAPSSSGLMTRRRVKKLKYVWVEKRRPDEEDDADLVGPMPLARVGDQHVGGDWGGALRPGARATDDP